MTPEQCQQVEIVAAKALALPLGEREAMLIGLDPEVRAEVERLLRTDPPAKPVSWVRRNPGVVVLSLALILAVVGCVVMTQFRLEAIRQRNLAEQREKIARVAVDDLLTITEGTIDSLPRMTRTQLEAMERALSSYIELSRESDDPATRYKMAQAYHFLARLQNHMGQNDHAEKALNRQLALLESLPPDPKGRFDQFNALLALHACLTPPNRANEEAIRTRALTILRELVRDEPKEPIYRDALSRQMFAVGVMHSNRGEVDAALRAFREGGQLAEDLVKAHPGRKTLPDFRSNVFSHLMAMATLATSAGAIDDAAGFYRQAVTVGRELVTDHPLQPSFSEGLINALVGLADALDVKGQSANALRFAEEALTRRRVLAADFPNLPHYRAELVSSLLVVGWLRHEAGDDAGAFELAFAIQEKLVEQVPNVASTKAFLALMHATVPGGRPARAVELTKSLTETAPYVELARATAFVSSGDPRDALQALSRLQPYRKEKLVLEGLARRALRDPAGAEACFALASRGKPLTGPWRHLLNRLQAAIMVRTSR